MTNDPATWAVVGDAWEELEPHRAWYAFLRSRGYARHIVTRLRAAELEHVIQRYEASPGIPAREIDFGFGSLSNDDLEELDARGANKFRGQLELFKFMTEQPKSVYAYSGYGTALAADNVVTFMGDGIGRIVRRGKITRPFGRGGQIQSVGVVGTNGFNYSGTCAVENGTYCKLRRGKPWLR